MRKDWIRKRQRKTQQISGIMRLANQTVLSTVTSVADDQQQQQLQFGSSAVVSQTQSSSVGAVQLTHEQQQPRALAPSVPASSSSASFDAHQLTNLINQSQCFPLNGDIQGVHHQVHHQEVQVLHQPTQTHDHYEANKAAVADPYAMAYNYDFHHQATQGSSAFQHHQVQPMMSSLPGTSTYLHHHQQQPQEQHSLSASIMNHGHHGHPYGEAVVECDTNGYNSQQQMHNLYHTHHTHSHHHHQQ